MKSPNFFETQETFDVYRYKKFILNFERILESLENFGCPCYTCPLDGVAPCYRNSPYKSQACRNTFPKAGDGCPCDANYSLPYLIRKVKAIIKAQESHKEEDR